MNIEVNCKWVGECPCCPNECADCVCNIRKNTSENDQRTNESGSGEGAVSKTN